MLRNGEALTVRAEPFRFRRVPLVVVFRIVNMNVYRITVSKASDRRTQDETEKAKLRRVDLTRSMKEAEIAAKLVLKDD